MFRGGKMNKFFSITKTYMSGESLYIVAENCTMGKTIRHMFDTEREAEDFLKYLQERYGAKND